MTRRTMANLLKSRPIIYSLLAAVSLWGYTVVNQDDPKSTVKPALKKRSTLASKDKADSGINEEDLKARFTPISDSPRNVFKPLIRRTQSDPGNGPLNAIPASFADGEAGWTYTGNAEVDGVMQALLENSSTQDGVYLKRGEHWKSLEVKSFGDDMIVVKGPDGEDRTFSLIVAGGDSLAPVNPPTLSGAIGDNLAVTADSSSRQSRRRNRDAAAAQSDVPQLPFPGAAGGQPGGTPQFPAPQVSVQVSP